MSVIGDIQYRGWNISLCHCGGFRSWGMATNTAFAHDSYDGAPDANDNRNGHAPTVEEAKQEIDDYENDLVTAGAGGIR